MKRTVFLAVVFPLLLGAVAVEKLAGQMEELTPPLREHLVTVLHELERTEQGKWLLGRISPEVRFSAKPMALLGMAETRNVITLESLRLENRAFKDTTAAHQEIKCCFTAEILSHELLHNAQFQAGLFRYPAQFSGFEAALCEMWMELQAKYFGERTFYELTRLPPYDKSVRPKAGLFLVMQRQASGDSGAEYAKTLWCNRHTTAAGKPLYRPQIREVSQWVLAYAEQAFRNNYARFLADAPDAGSEALAAHLLKITGFVAPAVPADFIIANAPVRRIAHGLACYEEGRPVMELVAQRDGYEKRVYSGKMVRTSRIRLRTAE